MPCIEIPDVQGFEPVRDDYTSGFASGVEAVKDWLQKLPPEFGSVSNAASMLEDMIELRRSA